MSLISDFKDLYGGLESAWTKSQVHIVAHTIAGVSLLLLAGVTLPPLTLPRIDIEQVIHNPWFQFAKDTGLIYIVLIIPIVLVSVYAFFLERLGQFLAFVIITLFRGEAGISYRDISWAELLPLAYMVNKDDSFELSDLMKLTTGVSTEPELSRAARPDSRRLRQADRQDRAEARRLSDQGAI